MKFFKRFIALVCVLVLCMSLFIGSAEAATSFTPITPGKYISLKSYYTTSDDGWDEIKTAHYYKLSLSSDSIVKIIWTGNNQDEADMSFYSDKAMKKGIYSYNLEPYGFIGPSAKGSTTIVLSKGVYYIEMYDGWGWDNTTPTTKVKFTVTPVANKANYCLSKAVSLSANKTLAIANTMRSHYTRWYKITLTKKQVIHTYTNNEDKTYDIRIYNSALSRVPTYSSGKRVSTKSAQKAGTYYIAIQPDINVIDRYLGEYTTIKWK